MEIIGFVGPSGTGKSHRAINVAFTNHCDGIIDDGLLIRGAKILAGASAKNEDNRIQAVKRAIFSEDSHAEEVRTALETSGIRRLLVIGTSDHMICKICNRLGIANPVRTVYIEQVATKAEIKRARQVRLQEGKHIVPVPTVELKPHFTGYFAELHRNLLNTDQDGKENDRSIVRPNFSFYGKLLIADGVIKDIINICLDGQEQIAKIINIRVRRRTDNDKGLVLSVEFILYYGSVIRDTLKHIQHLIKENVETVTGMQVQNVHVAVRSLAVKQG